MEAKWCGHCRKDGHNDAECWSTRVCTCNSYPHHPGCGMPVKAGMSPLAEFVHSSPLQREAVMLKVASKASEEQLALIRRVINEHREVLTALKDR